MQIWPAPRLNCKKEYFTFLNSGRIMEKIRLQKYFTDCGVLSRRAAESEIAAGAVTVNGIPASIGDKIIPGLDIVCWKGKPVEKRAQDAGHTIYHVAQAPGICHHHAR